MAVREAIPSKSDGVVNRRVKKSNKTARKWAGYPLGEAGVLLGDLWGAM